MGRLDLDAFAHGNLEEAEAESLVKVSRLETLAHCLWVLAVDIVPGSRCLLSPASVFGLTLLVRGVCTQSLTDTLDFLPLFDGEQPEERTVQLPLATTVIFQTEGPNPEEDNSAAEVHLQVSPRPVLTLNYS